MYVAGRRKIATLLWTSGNYGQPKSSFAFLFANATRGPWKAVPGPTVPRWLPNNLEWPIEVAYYY